MLGALNIEEQFGDLLEYLMLPVHPGNKLAALATFCQLLRSERMPIEPYQPELVDRLNFPEPRREYFGIDPRELDAQLEIISQAFSAPSSNPLPLSTKAALRFFYRVLALAYAYVGDFIQALEIQKGIPDSESGWLRETGEKLVGPPIARLQQLITDAEARRLPVAGALREMATEINRELADGSTFIPAVEKTSQREGPEGETGVLRRVTLEFPRKGKAPVERLETSTPIVGDNRARSTPFDPPAAAARALATEEGLPVRDVHLHAQVSFGRIGAFHQGSSSDLAVAAMAYCELRRLLHLREECHIRSQIALTGKLGADGAVQEVDARMIPLKVRAAFFSPVECLVVPRSQVEVAEETVRSLMIAYPHRELAVIGAGHLRDLFYDRRIVSKTLAPLPVHFVRGIWRRRRAVALGLILALSGTVGAILYGPIDKNPVDCRVDGEMLTLLNRTGQVVAGMPLTPRTAHSMQLSVDPASYRRLVAFGDIIGDERNEVFFVTRPPIDSDEPDSIVCASPDGREIHWRKPMTFGLDFPESPDALSNAFRVGELAFEVLEQGGQTRLVVLANHVFFPSIVLILDPGSGETLSSYLHVGTLGDMAIADIDGDLVREILVAGTNNAFDQACFCVLDPIRLGGHSPTRGRYVVRGLAPAHEKAYFLIPRTIVGQAFVEKFSRNGVVRVGVEMSNGEVVLAINDAGGLIGEGAQALYPEIYLRLGFDLSPKGFASSTGYDLVARTLVASGRLKELPGKSYYEAFLDSIRMVEGTGKRQQ